MDIFLPQKDDLSRVIQEKAADLLNRLNTLPVETLGLPYHCLEYFKSSHFKRLFFSIETSAHLLHRSITLKGKPVNDIVIMDYGAGVGTLYMLAKMIGCKTVIYNDHLEDWKTSALLIANAIGVDVARTSTSADVARTSSSADVARTSTSAREINKTATTHNDEYIVGDIKDTLEILKQKNIQCDIITSRNVIEHIYKLDNFYNIISDYQPDAIIYSSTTANYHNPASHIKHMLWHRKWEKHFLPQRIERIKNKFPGLPEAEVLKLAKATRGLALDDFDAALENYKTRKILPDPSIHHTNTVETSSGVWFEHLLPFKTYLKLIPASKYDVTFEPGFWDTHNRSKLKNVLGTMLNPFVKLPGITGIRLAPFIYVVALPKHHKL